ncbi:MAG: hypothetical protein Q8K30_06665 [Candidatus Gracilibacteria bacterium]|nr:hypothetical protein [Candidatus Gracilibacteria bacterium]
MKKITKRLITTTLLIIALIGFYIVNSLNYIKHIEIKRSFVEHPENLPTKEAAVNSSIGFRNLKADIYWLETIQYIGGNAIGSEYKKYLYVILDLITELNPYFEHPYIIGQLLLPSYNERYENLPKEEQQKNIDESIKLGLKGIENFCEMDKIELIKNEDDLQKIWTDEKYKNPCKSYNVPSYLAYIYYYYNHDPQTAALYYKVASAVDDSLAGSKIMAAIMSGKGGNREKSYFMFLNIAKYIETEDKACLEFAGNLEQAGAELFINKRVDLNATILKNIENSRVKIFGTFTEEKEEDILSDTKCHNYINKAIRELNLEYIERAEARYFKDKSKHSLSAKELFEQNYIEFLPVDFQQYKDYGIIYFFNTEIGNYDYKMGTYEELGL